MIIIKLKGGLGNQMFQYAVGRALQKRMKYEVAYDTSDYTKDLLADKGALDFLFEQVTSRHFGLDHFNISLREATREQVAPFTTTFKKLLRKVQFKLSPPHWYSVDEKVLHTADNTYLEGWWQTDHYFKDYADVIRKDFTLKHPFGVSAQSIFMSMKEFRLPGFSSVSLHIRRGDYISNPHAAAHHGVLDISYYEKALHVIEEKTQKRLHLFIFSDDIDWARKNIQTDHSVSFVSSPDIQDYEEIMLMSHCDHNIIANSTFSWWGAWLNPSSEKIVIAPKRWLANPAIKTNTGLPSDWIRI